MKIAEYIALAKAGTQNTALTKKDKYQREALQKSILNLWTTFEMTTDNRKLEKKDIENMTTEQLEKLLQISVTEAEKE